MVVSSNLITSRIAIALAMLLLARVAAHSQVLEADDGKRYYFPTVFGWKDGESVKEHLLTLMGIGMLQSDRSLTTDSLITAWITLHPRASVVPITTATFKEESGTLSKVTYCWLVHAGDTLNLEMVKQGCVPANTMLRPKAPDELTEEERKNLPDTTTYQVKVFVKEDDFKAFMNAVRKAGEEAFLLKRGLWKDN